MALLLVVGILLIFIVLLQRGRGGGLAGALGGMGGQSAFGTKAGDLFTRITIGVAAVWIQGTQPDEVAAGRRWHRQGRRPWRQQDGADVRQARR